MEFIASNMKENTSNPKPPAIDARPKIITEDQVSDKYITQYGDLILFLFFVATLPKEIPAIRLNPATDDEAT